MNDFTAAQFHEKVTLGEACFECITTAPCNAIPAIWHHILPIGDDNGEFLDIA